MNPEDRGFRIEKPIVFFDLETTGLDAAKDRIVEIGAIKLHPSGKRSKLDMRIRPGIPIPAEAVAIHGITDALVDNCPLFEAVAQKVFDFFDGCDIGGFNVIKFDMLMLASELKRVGLTLKLDGVAVIDGLRIFHMREPRDLSAGVAFYTSGFHVGAHSALADADAAIRVVLGQLEMYSDLPTTATELFEYTREPGAVDVGGKLVKIGEAVCFTFGKYKGEPLWNCPTHYLEWTLANVPFGSDAAGIVRDQLAGRNTRGNKPPR